MNMTETDSVRSVVLQIETLTSRCKMRSSENNLLSSSSLMRLALR
jgi:hypothetical protein